MAELRKSWRVIPKAGSFNNLHLVEEELQLPGKGEVLVDVKALGLNFADIFAIFGLYSATPKGSFIPGLEFSGIVRATGEGVDQLKEGQRVMGVSRFGAYTTVISTKQEYLIPLPDEWTMEEGAAYLVQVLTAWYGLVDLGNIKKGATVLIQSAAGGVGIWANRIARSFGAYTIGAVGSESKLKILEEEAYDKGIVRDRNFGANLRNALGDRELNIVMECIGGDILMESYKQMAMEGRLIVYGSARYAQPGSSPNRLKLLWKYFQSPKIDPQRMIEQNKSIMGFNLIYLFNNSDKMWSILSELNQRDIGIPLVGHRFVFEDLRLALELFLSGKTTGKVVVTTPS